MPVACDTGTRLQCSRDVDKLGAASRGPEDGRANSSELSRLRKSSEFLADTVSSEVRADTAQCRDVQVLYNMYICPHTYIFVYTSIYMYTTVHASVHMSCLLQSCTA